MKLTLPTDSAERKDVPVMSGCMNYFPAALAWIARISLKGDRKHNPQNAGNPPFHARGKSMDHGDCIVRHTIDIEDLKAAIVRDDAVVPKMHRAVPQLLEEAAYRAWRACAELQELCEKYADAPLAPAARLPSAAQQHIEATEAGATEFRQRLMDDVYDSPALRFSDGSQAGLSTSAAELKLSVGGAPHMKKAQAEHERMREAASVKAMRGRLEGERFPDEGNLMNGS